jgi:hypothetical protein
MNDMLAHTWANEIQRKLILSIVVCLAAFVLGRVPARLVVSRLPDDNPHIHAMPQRQPAPAVSQP